MDVVAAPQYKVKAIESSELARLWKALVDMVYKFGPDVVILVARKVPRLAELLKLHFGDRVIVLTDFAIPFCTAQFYGKRIAIIDDVVNVGSTIENALRAVMRCGSGEIATFALGRRRSSTCGLEVNYVLQETLDERTYQGFVAEVPRVLLGLAKPYDLEFPVLPCTFAVPFTTAEQIHRALRAAYPAGVVRDLSIDREGTGLRRFSIDVGADAETVYKLRIYVDESTQTANVVPMAIPTPSVNQVNRRPEPEATRQIVDAIRDDECCTMVQTQEARFRAQMFGLSLEFGWRQHRHLVTALAPASEPWLDANDVSLLFGPTVTEQLVRLSWREIADTESSRMEPGQPSTSPFADKVLTDEFVAEVVAAAESPLAYDVFRSLFCTLALRAGASDPATYSLTWPYSRDTIQDNPYTRLRIGPTAADIVTFLRKALPLAEERLVKAVSESDVTVSTETTVADWGSLWLLASGLLDYAIDCGGVVPTLGSYNGRVYRIYRKGENELRDQATQTLLTAWADAGPMSLTRFAKINAILALSSSVPRVLDPHTLWRGNVGSFQDTCLDTDHPEAGQYLRNIGLVTRVSDEPPRP